MIRALQAGWVALFLLMLWAPTLEERFGILVVPSLDENRSRAPRPSGWGALFVEGAPFARQYDSYFNDSFGFRDFLIRAKNQLDYSIFGENDKVLVGRDGWLFYKSVDQEQVYLETEARPHLERVFARLVQLNTVLAARGITLVIVPCPMNSTVLPEEQSPAAARRPRTTTFELYRHFLKAHPEIVTIDPLPILLGLKSRTRVYHKTDFHWTDPAAAYVAKDLVDRLGEVSGVGALWAQPLEIEKRPSSDGGEASAMGLLWPLVEERWMLKQDRIRQASGRLESFGPNEWIYESDAPSEAALLPPTVLFGDSFADGFGRAGANVYFRRLQKHYNYAFAKNYPTIPPGTRFVVLEHIESVLNQMATDAFWPDLAATNSTPPVETGEVVPAPVSHSDIGGTLVADPDPVPICSRTGHGATSISWTTNDAVAVEVRVGAPDGLLFASARAAGSKRTDQWVARGTTFYLQKVEGGAPLTAENTLARLTVQAVDGPCAP
jgi:hypothetical protein